MTDASSRIRFDASDVDPDVPVAEVATTTHYQESRAAMGIVAALRECGVPVRDIVVVARDLDDYEDPLTRAAIRHGITPVFWTQLSLTETGLYQLLASVCDLFGTAEPDPAVLLRPLELQWTPQTPTDEWPVPAEVLVETYRELPDESRSIEAWRSLLNDALWADSRVADFVEWVATHPEPTPRAVATVLAGVIKSYREAVLPHQRTSDSPALLETETAARTLVRLETLVEQVESKYAQRLADGWTEESWETVGGICESIATQRPGRREHANALALDVLEANDIWARKIPFVIAVGLVEGQWPRQPESVVPTEIRHAILAGTGPAKRLSPRMAWMGGRDHDQFVDTLRAATAGLVVTRHTQDVDGVQRFRSSLLDSLDVDRISHPACKQLLSTDRTLPDAVRSMLSDADADASEVSSDG